MEMDKNMCLWEIFVPASNKKEKFSYEHHKEWDRLVTSIAGGVTILGSAKGEWISPTGKIYKDRIIPVRISCTDEQMDEIMKMTLKHYNQDAIMAYKLSNETKTLYK